MSCNGSNITEIILPSSYADNSVTYGGPPYNSHYHPHSHYYANQPSTNITGGIQTTPGVFVEQTYSEPYSLPTTGWDTLPNTDIRYTLVSALMEPNVGTGGTYLRTYESIQTNYYKNTNYLVKGSFPTPAPSAGEITAISGGNYGLPDATRTANTYTNVTGSTNGSGISQTFTIVVDGVGAITVTITNGGTGHVVGDVITIPSASIGSTGSGFTFEIATITAITYDTSQLYALVSYTDATTASVLGSTTYSSSTLPKPPLFNANIGFFDNITQDSKRGMGYTIMSLSTFDSTIFKSPNLCFILDGTEYSRAAINQLTVIGTPKTGDLDIEIIELVDSQDNIPLITGKVGRDIALGTLRLPLIIRIKDIPISAEYAIQGIKTAVMASV